jgi:hypothetical protein
LTFLLSYKDFLLVVVGYRRRQRPSRPTSTGTQVAEKRNSLAC